jgi:hypothetical protein
VRREVLESARRLAAVQRAQLSTVAADRERYAETRQRSRELRRRAEREREVRAAGAAPPPSLTPRGFRAPSAGSPR